MNGIIKAGLLVLIALALCGEGYALDLLYPLDGTYVTKSNYLIIKGGTDPELSGISVEINGVKSDIIDITPEPYRAVFGDMLILEPVFDPGENKIVVEGFLGAEKMGTVVATVYYQSHFNEAPPAGYQKEVFHLPAREEVCKGCHDMTPSTVALSNPDPRSNPCGSCHARMLNQPHVHGPAGVYECTYCHEIDSVPTKYQARPGDAELCTECHEDKMKTFSLAKFVHGPLEAGLCMVCHDPHASQQPAQLILPAYDLCVECHAQVASEPHVVRGSVGKLHPLKGVTNPAGNGEDLSCASCHNPHSGPTEEMFNWGVTSRFSLCSKCHNK